MAGFDDIRIGWKGQEYRVPPNKCMGLLAEIEDVLAPPGSPQSALELLGAPNKAHLTKLARAYAVALRYAGCPVTDEEVYLSLANSVMQGGAEGYEAILTLAAGLMAMFFPDWTAQEGLAAGAEPGKGEGAEGAAPSSGELSESSMPS